MRQQLRIVYFWPGLDSHLRQGVSYPVFSTNEAMFTFSSKSRLIIDSLRFVSADLLSAVAYSNVFFACIPCERFFFFSLSSPFGSWKGGDVQQKCDDSRIGMVVKLCVAHRTALCLRLMGVCPPRPYSPTRATSTRLCMLRWWNTALLIE